GFSAATSVWTPTVPLTEPSSMFGPLKIFVYSGPDEPAAPAGPCGPVAPVGPCEPAAPCAPVAPASPIDASSCHDGFAPGLLKTHVDGTLGFTQPLGGIAAVAIQLDPSAPTASFGAYDDEPTYELRQLRPTGPLGPIAPSSPFFASRFQKSGFGGAAALMQTFPIGAGPQPPVTGAIATHDEPRCCTASSIAYLVSGEYGPRHVRPRAPVAPVGPCCPTWFQVMRCSRSAGEFAVRLHGAAGGSIRSSP